MLEVTDFEFCFCAPVLFESLKIKGRCCWEAKAQKYVCIHDKQKQSTGIHTLYIYTHIYSIYIYSNYYCMGEALSSVTFNDLSKLSAFSSSSASHTAWSARRIASSSSSSSTSSSLSEPFKYA